MALREFTGADGREWHVWDITPDKMHPSTRAEDYLQGVLEGWLVFEAEGGKGKARLYPIPATWATASDEELRVMLSRAEPVREPAERRSGPTQVAAELETSSGPSSPKAPDREVPRSGSSSIDVRTFRYPRGRVWTVAERSTSDQGDGSSRVILRFSSGTRNLDMDVFPAGWMRYTDDQLINLLIASFPRPADHTDTDSEYQRRRGDTTRS
jgi:hypothetical protein